MKQVLVLKILALLFLTSCRSYDLELRFTNLTNQSVNVIDESGKSINIFPDQYKTYKLLKVNEDEIPGYSQIPSFFGKDDKTMTFVFTDGKKIVFPEYSDVDTIQTLDYDWNFGHEIYNKKKTVIYEFRITESDYQRAK